MHAPKAQAMPMEGVRVSKRSLAPADVELTHAMVDLAVRSCPGVDVRGYLLPRLIRYDYAIVGESNRDLLAFELVQEFEEGGERYVYLGPLFSRRAACVPMFASFFRTIAGGPDGTPFHLLAEVQNPRVALMLKRLFLRSSYPRIGSRHVPPRIERVVSRFSARLDHVGPVDATRLSAPSTETLFRHARGYESVERWMRRRGVNLGAGDSQLFVVSSDGSARNRRALDLDLSAGESALAGWRDCKRDMLHRFERGTR